MTKPEAPVQHDDGCTFDESKDDAGMGFGLAGGGYGPYTYCPVCGVILWKGQERDD